MVEEETKYQKRKRKLRNTFEIEKKEPSELVSGTDSNRELHKFRDSSLLLGEGATNKSCGESKTTLYLDGTSLDNNRRLPANSTDGWVDE